jgi:hypothetical protein
MCGLLARPITDIGFAHFACAREVVDPRRALSPNFCLSLGQLDLNLHFGFWSPGGVRVSRDSMS